MKFTKKKVFAIYGILDAIIFIGIFLINLIGAKSTIKEALCNAFMFSVPLFLLGLISGVRIFFHADADEAYEKVKDDDDDYMRQNWENQYRNLGQ